MEKIQNRSVVTFDFVARTSAGQELDSSISRGEPLHVLLGADNVIEGIEDALLGMSVGDSTTLDIPAAKAYGEYADELVQNAPRDAFQIDHLEVGDRFNATTEDGEEISVKVTDIDGDSITVDGNHELAGLDLNFSITVLAVREATEVELEIGQAIEDEA